MIVALPFLSAGSMIDQLDRSALVKLIDAAQRASCRDVSFDYEGKRVFPGPLERESQELGADGIERVYTGTYRRRSDGATLVDIYAQEKSIDRPRHGRVAILNGRTESSSIYADEKKAQISITAPGPLAYAGTGNYRIICLADWVRIFAESPYLYDAWSSDSAWSTTRRPRKTSRSRTRSGSTWTGAGTSSATNIAGATTSSS